MKRIIHVIITFLLMMPLAAKAAPVGMITGVAGGASWREKINIPYSKLVKGMVISEGNWIRTGPDGWVELTLNDKSKFTLANNTEFEINSFLLTKKGVTAHSTLCRASCGLQWSSLTTEKTI